MRRLVVAIVLAVMLIVLFPLVESGIVPPWPAGWILLGDEVALSAIAVSVLIEDLIEERRINGENRKTYRFEKFSK